jgi:hypothetical protein
MPTPKPLPIIATCINWVLELGCYVKMLLTKSKGTVDCVIKGGMLCDVLRDGCVTDYEFSQLQRYAIKWNITSVTILTKATDDCALTDGWLQVTVEN